MYFPDIRRLFAVASEHSRYKCDCTKKVMRYTAHHTICDWTATATHFSNSSDSSLGVLLVDHISLHFQEKHCALIHAYNADKGTALAILEDN